MSMASALPRPGCTRPARVVNACNPDRENKITQRCKDHETFEGRGEDRQTELEKQNPELNVNTRPLCRFSECNQFAVPDPTYTKRFRALCGKHDKEMREKNKYVGKAILAYEKHVAEGRGICKFVDGQGRKCLKAKWRRRSRAQGDNGWYETDYCDHHRHTDHQIEHSGPNGMPQVFWLF